MPTKLISGAIIQFTSLMISRGAFIALSSASSSLDDFSDRIGPGNRVSRDRLFAKHVGTANK